MATDASSLISDLLFSKIDVSSNELEGLDLRTYPQIRIYPKGKKDKPIDYSGNFSLEDIKKWLIDNSQAFKDFIQ